jgi:hypothetical protein
MSEVVLFPGGRRRAPSYDRILEAVLVACGELGYAAKRGASWRDGLRAALTELLEFCANQPAIAKAVIVEVHAAGPEAMAQRADLMERLSRALDGARREIPSRQAPPPVTSTFMVGAIDTLVAAKLMDGDAASAPELLPGLLYFVVKQYLGEDAAWEEMTAAPVVQWRARRSAAGAQER